MNLYEIFNLVFLIPNKITILRKKVVVGQNTTIMGIMGVHGNGKLIIGDRCSFLAGDSFNPSTGDSKLHFNTMSNGVICIGNNVGISNTSVTAMERIVIEDDVRIGSGCMIADTDFHSLNYIDRIEGDDKPKSSSIHIKKGAFIGSRAIILKGTCIGKNSIIGAGSVVAGNIPDYEIWAGNPARFIRKVCCPSRDSD